MQPRDGLSIGRAANACLGVRARDHEIVSGGTSGNVDFWHRVAGR